MGSYLLFHPHAREYHRHKLVLLLSSGRDQVGPSRKCHPSTVNTKVFPKPERHFYIHLVLKLVYFRNVGSLTSIEKINKFKL